MEKTENNKRILIVEDSEDDAVMMSHVVEKLLGFQATVVHDGRSAISAVLEGKFDLILLDINIPFLTGNRVASTIRRLDGYDTIPIVAVTAYDHAEVRRASLVGGCDIYLTKPVDIETLSEIIQLYLKKK